MAATQASSFGAILRHLRTEADLTQAELAERAQLSIRGLSDLERGVNTKPRRFTLSQLADALILDPLDRARFERAAAAAALDSETKDALPHGNFLGAIPDGRLVSREQEIDRIGSILDSVTEDCGHLLLLGGGRGCGKTRLLQEMTLSAQARGYAVLTGGCYSSEQLTPYHPFLEALSGLQAKVPIAARTEAVRGWKGIQQLVESAGRDAYDHAGKAERLQVSSAVSDTLLQVSHAAPVALFLDDLQWADADSLWLIKHLARATRDSRILLAGAFCDLHLADEHPAFGEMLQLLSHERLAECITVRRLSPEETTALLAGLMDGDDVSEEFAAFVYRRTKGNPRLIEAMAWSLGGRLELQGEIGAGSTGRVFRAFDRRTDMVVAAKLVLAREGIEVDDLLRFQQEGAMLASLDHPNIVRVYDTFAEEHAACIIMELLEGRSLAQVLQDGPTPLSEAKRIGVQVARALGYAHVQSIVHRDIKPDNVMVLAETRVKVTDFGIARILRTDNSLATIATTGMRAGTPSYMAPEQIAGKEIDGRADIYALGAMLFHMVAGRPPFLGPDKLAIAVKHLQDQPIAPSSIDPAVPPDWDALILKALAKDPRRRFQSARAMEQAIGELNERDEATVPRTSRREPVIAAGLLVALLVAVLLVWPWPGSTAQASVSSQIKTYLSGLAAHDQLSGTVLVARKGKTLVNIGYGLADKSAGIRNGPNTRYGVSGVSQSFSIVGVLQAVEQGGLRWNDPVCKYLPTCVPSWRPITVGMAVDGTADFPSAGFGIVGHSPDQSLIACQKAPLDAIPGSRIEYQDCGDIVLGMLIQNASIGSWGQAGVFLFSKLMNTGQLTNSFSSPERALAYDQAKLDTATVFNDFFAAYSTAPDILSYDNALFGGQFLSPRDTDRIFRPRHSVHNGAPGVDPTDYGVADSRWGLDWKVGRLLRHSVAYTLGSMSYFQAANVRFQKAGVTVIVLANDVRNNVWGIATHAAALVFGQRPPSTSALPRSSTLALMGTYQRTFTKADLRRSRDTQLRPWVGLTFKLVIGRNDFRFLVGADEYYRAYRDGRLLMLAFNVGKNTNSFCDFVPAETPPTGYYRWSLHRRDLVITRVQDNRCGDRAGLIPGTWKRIS